MGESPKSAAAPWLVARGVSASCCATIQRGRGRGKEWRRWTGGRRRHARAAVREEKRKEQGEKKKRRRRGEGGAVGGGEVGGRPWRSRGRCPAELPCRRPACTATSPGPTSPSGLRGGRLRKQHRAWLLREGAVPGVVALRPLLSCCAPRRRPCLLPLHRVGPPASIFTELAGTPRSWAAAPG
jgi:hypothetical protein